MSEKRGFGKSCLFGCLGLFALVLLFVVVMFILAGIGSRNQKIGDHELAASNDYTVPAVAQAEEPRPAKMPGRVILELANGEFKIRPGEPGTGVVVKATFDEGAFALEDTFAVLPDSTWVYRVTYHRTIPGLQHMFMSFMGKGGESKVDIFLPPDIPMVLEVAIKEGGADAELGGLWLGEALFEFNKGGFALDIEKPLVQPIDRMVIRGSMGGLEASHLGNASPRMLDVACKMGGVELDLSGAWLGDCDAVLSVEMGGMAVIVPSILEVEGLPVEGSALRHEDSEVPTPVLRVSSSQKRGEIEVIRR